MTAALALIRETATDRWRRLLIWGLAIAIGFQLLMLAALIIRFGQLPNYLEIYNWPGSVWHIIQSTPSWSDMAPIIAEEWLLEIGYMTHEYGAGLSVWSLNVVPSRLVVMFGLGALTGLSVEIASSRSCAAPLAGGAGAATGLGAMLVAMTNATMSWVVCCAAPSWVVGLAMLGVGVSTSLALEHLGSLLTAIGFGLLCLSIFVIAWVRTRQRPEPFSRIQGA